MLIPLGASSRTMAAVVRALRTAASPEAERGRSRRRTSAPTLRWLYFVEYTADGKAIRCKEVDSAFSPVGDAFDVVVLSYGTAAVDFQNFDLRGGLATPILAQGVLVLGLGVGADTVCVAPHFIKGC